MERKNEEVEYGWSVADHETISFYIFNSLVSVLKIPSILGFHN